MSQASAFSSATRGDWHEAESHTLPWWPRCPPPPRLRGACRCRAGAPVRLPQGIGWPTGPSLPDWPGSSAASPVSQATPRARQFGMPGPSTGSPAGLPPTSYAILGQLLTPLGPPSPQLSNRITTRAAPRQAALAGGTRLSGKCHSRWVLPARVGRFSQNSDLGKQALTFGGRGALSESLDPRRGTSWETREGRQSGRLRVTETS